MGEGAATGTREANARNKVKLGAFDASPTQQRDLRTRAVDFLLVQRPYEIGYEAAESFKHAGGEALHRCPCLNDHPLWIRAMQTILQDEGKGWL